MGLEDIFYRVPRAQVAQDRVHGDPGALDDRSAVADFRVEFNSMFHAKRLGTAQKAARGKIQRVPYLEMSLSASAMAMPVTWSML